MVKIYAPCNNLGCLGFRISERIYFDFYKESKLGMFLKVSRHRWTVTINSIREWR